VNNEALGLLALMESHSTPYVGASALFNASFVLEKSPIYSLKLHTYRPFRVLIDILPSQYYRLLFLSH
jgi:hypothetical protein